MAIEVGLGLKSGQELLMTASLDAVPLARRITEQAYRAGASLVTTLYTDDEATLMRFRYAPDDAFDRAAGWLYDGMGAAFKSGAARLAITGRQSPAAVQRGSRQGGPRQPGRLQSLPARARVDHPPRNQLDHRGQRHALLGRGHVSRRSARDRAGQTVGSNLRHLAHQRRRPGEPTGRRTTRNCTSAPRT